MRRTLATSATALLIGSAAVADEWSVLVVGADGDAIQVSGQLAAAGVQDVRHLLDGSPRDIAGAVADLAGAERALVYFSGPLAERGGQPAIGDDPRLTMAALADTLAAGGAQQAAILIENCGADASNVQIAPPIGSVRGDILLAASAGPGAACSGPVLSQAISSASLSTPLESIVSGGWVGVAPSATMSLEPSAGAPAGAVAFIEARAEGTTVAAAPAGNEVQTALFIAPPASQIAAIPVAAGLPQPSIIVGIIEVEPETIEVAAVVEENVEEGVAGAEIAFDNVEARVALRESDPDLFATLVAGGALDPPEVELATAIQTELARMECYTSTIDGIFGRGSQGAVRRYYEERDVAVPASLEASVEIFRDIISNEDVTCPPPPAPVAQTRTTSSSSSGSTRTTTQAAPRAAPAAPRAAPAPAPAPSSPRTITGGGSSLGVFR